jgi:hypothetical protein
VATSFELVDDRRRLPPVALGALARRLDQRRAPMARLARRAASIDEHRGDYQRGTNKDCYED